QLKRRGIKDPRVLNAMMAVDRTIFVPVGMASRAYEDGPLPIGMDQTISQPYIVAYMAEALKLEPEDIVMEVGTGCGYNAAVLSRIAAHVYSVEIVKDLSDLARENLAASGIDNVSTRVGDGYKGWPEEAPFDAIILTAATPEIPEPLKNQLKIGGRLLAPVGEAMQHLMLWEKEENDIYKEKALLPVKFVP